MLYTRTSVCLKFFTTVIPDEGTIDCRPVSKQPRYSWRLGSDARYLELAGNGFGYEGLTVFTQLVGHSLVTVVAQGTDATLTWETDEFSTYLIAYKDGNSGSNGGTTPSGNPNPNANTAQQGNSGPNQGTPATGDNSFTGAVAPTIAGAALALALCFILKRLSKHCD